MINHIFVHYTMYKMRNTSDLQTGIYRVSQIFPCLRGHNSSINGTRNKSSFVELQNPQEVPFLTLTGLSNIRIFWDILYLQCIVFTNIYIVKSKSQSRVIVFDELELILYVNQGLTLSTASLVHVYLNLFLIDVPPQFKERILN